MDGKRGIPSQVWPRLGLWRTTAQAQEIGVEYIHKQYIREQGPAIMTGGLGTSVSLLHGLCALIWLAFGPCHPFLPFPLSPFPPPPCRPPPSCPEPSYCRPCAEQMPASAAMSDACECAMPPLSYRPIHHDLTIASRSHATAGPCLPYPAPPRGRRCHRRRRHSLGEPAGPCPSPCSPGQHGSWRPPPPQLGRRQDYAPSPKLAEYSVKSGAGGRVKSKPAHSLGHFVRIPAGRHGRGEAFRHIGAHYNDPEYEPKGRGACGGARQRNKIKKKKKAKRATQKVSPAWGTLPRQVVRFITYITQHSDMTQVGMARQWPACVD